MNEALSEYLSWDSEFFGVRIGRVVKRRLQPQEMESALEWAKAERIACLYLLVGSADHGTVRLAEKYGFLMTGQRITFERSLESAVIGKQTEAIRLAQESDIPCLAAIARESHHDSRFYFDEHFARSRCDDLYAVWIEKSCRGWAQRVFVAEAGSEPSGYCTCHLSPGSVGSIGLIAVAQSGQGRGLGQALVSAALAFFAQAGFSRAEVVTQGCNIAALRLYERCGFLAASVELWYHKWLGGPDLSNAALSHPL